MSLKQIFKERLTPVCKKTGGLKQEGVASSMGEAEEARESERYLQAVSSITIRN